MTEPGEPPPPDPTIDWLGAPDDEGAVDQPAAGPAVPWYRRPGPLAAVVVGGVALLGLGWFTFLRDDDAPPKSTVSILRIERTDILGEPLVRDLVVDIDGEAGSEDAFVWLIPPNGQAPLPAVMVTDRSTGRAEFQWGPTNDVSDPEHWISEIRIWEQFGAQESLVARDFECSYERRGEPAGQALLRVSFDDGGDLRAPRTASYHFLGYRFQPGDVTTCLISNGSSGPGATSTSGEAGSTATGSTDPSDTPPETTTPAEGSTPTETTTPGTTAPGTTQPGTTQPGTTQPGTTAPAAVTTVMSVIDSRADLSTLSDLIDFVELRDAFADPAAVLTLFAPNNQALDDFDLVPGRLTEEDKPFVRDILLAHLHSGDSLLSTSVVALTELDVEFGGPQPIDGTSEPPTFGFVDIIEFDLTAANGVVHVLDDVVDPEPEG